MNAKWCHLVQVCHEYLLVGPGLSSGGLFGQGNLTWGCLQINDLGKLTHGQCECLIVANCEKLGWALHDCLVMVILGNGQ